MTVFIRERSMSSRAAHWLGTLTGGCRAKGSPRMRSIRRQLSDSYVSEKKPGSCEKVTLQRSPACCACFEQVKSNRGAPIASDRPPDCSAAVSALLAAGARIIRGDDYAPDACRKRASGGVFSD